MNSIDPEQLKRKAAQAALQFIPENQILGVGTGSTVRYFIEELAAYKDRIPGAVSSSDDTSQRLRKLGIPIVELNDVHEKIGVYIDGADESNANLQLIKGGGAALTREKIVAQMSETFVCIVDERKVVTKLGKFPLPLEVIPMARNQVAREMSRLGGQPAWREGVMTDNGNIILDVHELQIDDPCALEAKINQIPGVVTVGLFAHRGADTLIIAGANGIQIHQQQMLYSS